MTSSFDTKHAFRAVPLLCSFMAFILAMLALFAGNKPGILEGYNIITVDASGLSNNIGSKVKRDALPSIRTSIDSASANSLPPTLPSPGEQGGDQLTSDIDNDIIDGPKKNGPVGTFYALYALTICEGGLTPDGDRQLTECYTYFSSSDEIATIPALLSTRNSDTDSAATTHSHSHSTRNTGTGTGTALTETGLTYKLQAALDGLDTLFKSVGVLLAIGTSFTGLSLFAGLPALAVSSETYQHTELAYDWAVWTNLTFASAAVLFLLLAALVAAAGAKDAEVRINKLGEEFGVTAVMGVNWIALSWAVVGLMVVVLVYWAVRGGCLRRAEEKGEKRQRQQPDEEAAPEEGQEYDQVAWRRKMEEEDMRQEQSDEDFGRDKKAPGWRQNREESWKSRERRSEARGQPRSRRKEPERYTPSPATPEPPLSPPKRSRRANNSPPIIGQAY